MLTQEQRSNLSTGLARYAITLVSAIAIFWFLEIADWLLPGRGLDGYGIQPRTADGFRNILFAPFLHYGFDHLIGNTIPFVVLGGLVIIRRESDFLWVSAISALVSGLGIWALGFPNTVHLGVSGVIFGYMGYLLLRGYFERSILSIVIALFAGFLYGGMLFGLIMPFRPGISWLGHFFGFVGGGLAAYWMVKDE
ncbi:MAG: rhomboid family intramembrane serine protease [Chloroflexota bacterium]